MVHDLLHHLYGVDAPAELNRAGAGSGDERFKRAAELRCRRAAASVAPLRHGCGLSVRRPAGMFCC